MSETKKPIATLPDGTEIDLGDYPRTSDVQPGVYTLPQINGERKVIIIENPNKKEE